MNEACEDIWAVFIFPVQSIRRVSDGKNNEKSCFVLKLPKRDDHYFVTWVFSVILFEASTCDLHNVDNIDETHINILLAYNKIYFSN